MGHDDLQELVKRKGHRVSCTPGFIIQPVNWMSSSMMPESPRSPFQLFTHSTLACFYHITNNAKWETEDLKTAEEALLPSYQTPFSCYNENEHRSLHLRHQSNLLELFFDLFLAANLATFTESHSIVDKGSLIAYIGFFVGVSQRKNS
jgi:hypothetical protein